MPFTVTDTLQTNLEKICAWWMDCDRGVYLQWVDIHVRLEVFTETIINARLLTGWQHQPNIHVDWCSRMQEESPSHPWCCPFAPSSRTVIHLRFKAASEMVSTLSLLKRKRRKQRLSCVPFCGPALCADSDVEWLQSSGAGKVFFLKCLVYFEEITLIPPIFRQWPRKQGGVLCVC